MDIKSKLITTLNQNFKPVEKELILSKAVKEEVKIKTPTEKNRGTQTQLKTKCEHCGQEDQCDSYTTIQNRWLCINCKKFEFVLIENVATIKGIENTFKIKPLELKKHLNEKDFITKILVSVNLMDMPEEIQAKIKETGVTASLMGNIRNASLYMNLIEENILLIEVFTLEKKVFHYTFQVDNIGDTELRSLKFLSKEDIEINAVDEQ